MKRFYEELKYFFLENGIKYRKVAKIIDVAEGTFSKKINRKNADFTLDEVRLICEAFKINPNEYFFKQKCVEENTKMEEK